RTRRRPRRSSTSWSCTTEPPPSSAPPPDPSPNRTACLPPGRAVLSCGRRVLYIAAILANVVNDGHGEHAERSRGPSRLLAGQEAIPAARHRDHDRRRDGGH